MEKINEMIKDLKLENKNISKLDGSYMRLEIEGLNTAPDSPHYLPKMERLNLEGNCDKIIEIIRAIMRSD